jgi:hypothetical protein
MEKLKVMNSTMGTRPDMAAPTPMPVKPASVMGVSTTRSRPNFSIKPFDTCISSFQIQVSGWIH